MGERWIAHYRCRACKHEWKQEAGPVDCPKCLPTLQWVGRIDWLNYEALADKTQKGRTQ